MLSFNPKLDSDKDVSVRIQAAKSMIDLMDNANGEVSKAARNAMKLYFSNLQTKKDKRRLTEFSYLERSVSSQKLSWLSTPNTSYPVAFQIMPSTQHTLPYISPSSPTTSDDSNSNSSNSNSPISSVNAQYQSIYPQNLTPPKPMPLISLSRPQVVVQPSAPGQVEQVTSAESEKERIRREETLDLLSYIFGVHKSVLPLNATELSAAELHYECGKKLLERKNYEDARKQFELSRTKNPILSKAYLGISIALSNENKVLEGIEVLHQLIALDPNNAKAYFNKSVFTHSLFVETIAQIDLMAQKELLKNAIKDAKFSIELINKNLDSSEGGNEIKVKAEKRLTLFEDKLNTLNIIG